MTRRIRNLYAAAALGAGMAGTVPQVTAAEPPPPQTGTRIPRSVQTQIAELEARIAARPDSFDYDANNGLRHLHWVNGEYEKSVSYANAILKASTMDDYVVNILGDWQIDKDAAKAVESLNDFAGKYANQPFVVAACLIKAGDLTESDAAARVYYQKVAEMTEPGLEAYTKIAKDVVGKLGAQSGTDSFRTRRGSRR